MSFINLYQPYPAEDLRGYLGPNPYDINFIFPLHFSTLESERVKLTPFIPAHHARDYLDQVNADPSLERWLPFTHRTLDDLLAYIEKTVRRDPGWILFAIIDKPSNKLAGVIGLINSSLPNLAAEIGWIIVFPAFQRTYVASNAIGLLLRYCLGLPTAELPGLGLRRVQWTANPMNAPSIRTAKRLGFQMEGTLRWAYVLPEGKEGTMPRVGDPRERNPGRESALLAIYADDWESGAREEVDKLINRL